MYSDMLYYAIETIVKDTTQVFGGVYSLLERQQIFSMECIKWGCSETKVKPGTIGKLSYRC